MFVTRVTWCQFLQIVHYWLPLRFSRDCPLLIAPSVFSRLSIIDCPFGFLGIVHYWLPLRCSRDCPLLIAPSVFSNVYFNYCCTCSRHEYAWNIDRSTIYNRHSFSQSWVIVIMSLAVLCHFSQIILNQIMLFFVIYCLFKDLYITEKTS